MSKTIHTVFISIGITFTGVLLIAAVVWGYMMTPTDTPCSSIEYIIEDSHERMYVTPHEIDNLLRKEGVYPVGKSLNMIALSRIESVVRNHPMVRYAECYLTPRNEVRVNLTQRVPLLRVQTPWETYIIDTDRRKMPMRASIKDKVLVVTGSVGEQVASSALADFAEWVQKKSFWQEKIHYVHMKTPQIMILYLRGENEPRIMMGPIRGYESKLYKLRTFMENSQDNQRDKKYYEIDVRFRGQVIGRH